MGFRFAEKALAPGVFHRLKETVEHNYVLAGKNRLSCGLRPYPADEIYFPQFRAILKDYALGQMSPES